MASWLICHERAPSFMVALRSLESPRSRNSNVQSISVWIWILGTNLVLVVLVRSFCWQHLYGTGFLRGSRDRAPGCAVKLIESRKASRSVLGVILFFLENFADCCASRDSTVSVVFRDVIENFFWLWGFLSIALLAGGSVAMNWGVFFCCEVRFCWFCVHFLFCRHQFYALSHFLWSSYFVNMSLSKSRPGLMGWTVTCKLSFCEAIETHENLKK